MKSDIHSQLHLKECIHDHDDRGIGVQRLRKRSAQTERKVKRKSDTTSIYAILSCFALGISKRTHRSTAVSV